jgi:hypothetical protein
MQRIISALPQTNKQGEKMKKKFIGLEDNIIDSDVRLNEPFELNLVKLVLNGKAAKANQEIDDFYVSIKDTTHLTEYTRMNVYKQIGEGVDKRMKALCGDTEAALEHLKKYEITYIKEKGYEYPVWGKLVKNADKNDIRQELKKLMYVYKDGVEQEHFSIKPDKAKFEQCANKAKEYGSKEADKIFVQEEKEVKRSVSEPITKKERSSSFASRERKSSLSNPLYDADDIFFEADIRNKHTNAEKERTQSKVVERI